jgi:hypothetical protein
MTTQAIKPGPKRIATSTGKPDQRQCDNKKKILATHHHYKHQKSTHKKLELIHSYQNLKSYLTLIISTSYTVAKIKRY